MNNNKQSKLNSGRVRSLGLLDKTLPLTAATPPQLRNRRQFQFNGMHFETNPLSLHMARSGLDGDAGDARFPGPLQDWRDPPYQTYKTSSSSTANRVSTQRGSASPVNENPSHRAASQPIVSPGQSQLHQPEERSWRTDGTDNNQAGGEDAYNSNSYNMNHNNNSNSFNMNNKINDNMNNNNNNNNNYTQSNFNNNSNGNVNNDRFHQVLAKYNRSPNVDDYNNNNNSILSSNSFKGGSFENETKMKDDQSADRDHYAKEELQLPSRIYNRPLKVTGFRYGQMRAGGGFNAGAVTQSKMDYITLTGFLLGYLTSNVLFFLCWYFSWLKAQVVKLRQHFLGQTNLWEFFDFEDTTRYSMQTKLLLAPIILGCSILYCIVNMLHLLIKLVRSDVPRTVVDFVQRIAKSHWS